MNLDPLVVFIVVLLIGIVAGVLAQRVFRGSWLSQQLTGGRRADVTSALVGVAGAFIGFHIAALIFTSGEPIALFLGAVAGAVLVLWGWRAFKL
jgi:uncharacterized membrane protein YeaQ/YmgE (transglycosylase-associated protein family)